MRRKFVSSNNTSKALKIYVVADIHIDHTVDGDPNAEGAVRETRKYFYDASERLRKFKVEANEKSDYVLCLGDLVEDYAPENFDLFNEQWGGITKPKELTVGNHDLLGGSYADVVSQLGYENRTETAGSVFFRSFAASNQFVSTRIIMLDAQIDGAGTHTSQNVGLLNSDALNWIETEINNAQENSVIICSHQGPHTQYFDTTSANNLNTIVQNSLNANPRKKIHHLYGHNHGVQSVTMSDKFGSNYKGYLNPAILEYSNPNYGVFYVLPDGNLKTTTYKL